MLICGDCNARNNDGERFCSNCGAYLVWQQGPAAGEEPGPERTMGPEAGRRTGVTTAQLPVVPGAQGAPLGGRSAPARNDKRPPGSPAGPTSAAAYAGNARISPPDTFGATASMDPTPGDVLEERQPRQSDGRPPRDPEPHTLRAEAQQMPGGLTCRRCGADNKPDAAFCRQCGASLKEAAVVPIPPWWRQLLSRGKPAALPAGSRPRWRKPRRVSARAVSLLTVAGLFAGVTYVGRDVIALSGTRAVDEVLERPWSAQTITASGSAPGRGPELAVDGSAVRSWASNGPGPAYLEAGFTPPFHLTYVVITNGPLSPAAGAPPERRPAKVEIVAVRSDGQRSTLTVELNDTLPGPQNFYVGADQVSTVRLNILETTGPAGAGVSVAEVQFAGR